MIHLQLGMDNGVDADAPSNDVNGGSRLAALRHPPVVGALLTVITALIASVLVPALTRSWQDRPRELALKRELVARMARATATTIHGGRQFGEVVRERDTYATPPPIGRAKRVSFVHRSQYDWGVESSVIASELSTYFHDTSLRQRWRDFDEAVGRFLRLAARDRGASDDLFWHELLLEHFQPLTFQDPTVERTRKRFLSPGIYKERPSGNYQLNDAATLLFEESEQIQDAIVESDASGFSHGLWIFG